MIKLFHLFMLCSCVYAPIHPMIADEFNIQQEIAFLEFDNDGWKECEQEFIYLRDDTGIGLFSYYNDYVISCYRHISYNNQEIKELKDKLNGHSYYMKLVKNEKIQIEMNRINPIILKMYFGEPITKKDFIIFDITCKRIEKINNGEL